MFRYEKPYVTAGEKALCVAAVGAATGAPKQAKWKKLLLPGKTHVSRQIFIVIKMVLELFYDPTRNLWRNM